MKTFREWLNEAYINDIDKSSREASVTNKNKYNSADEFSKGSKKLGELHGLEIHQTEDGKSHFTWSPKDRMIHHVIRAVERDGNRFKYMTYGKREGSPPTGDIYHHLVTKHGYEFTGTNHSKGAAKMWQGMYDRPDVEIHGHDPVTGETKLLKKSDPQYAPHSAKDSESKKIGRMHLILKGKT